jgi:hypothetical protein
VEGEVFSSRMAMAAEVCVRGAKVAEGGELNGWVSVLGSEKRWGAADN